MHNSNHQTTSILVSNTSLFEEVYQGAPVYHSETGTICAQANDTIKLLSALQKQQQQIISIPHLQKFAIIQQGTPISLSAFVLVGTSAATTSDVEGANADQVKLTAYIIHTDTAQSSELPVNIEVPKTLIKNNQSRFVISLR